MNNPYYTRRLKVFLAAFFALCILSASRIPLGLGKILARISDFGRVAGMIADFSLTGFEVTFGAFLQSVWVAVLSTGCSALLGLVIGALAARNISPVKALSPAISAIFTFVRAVPTFIWVLLIMVCLGLGPAPAVAGVCVHSTAFFARAFTQAFEEVDEGVVSALAATGSNRAKSFFSAVLPASLRPLVAWLTMRFEVNFRESAILGMVGAGGIGYTITSHFRAYRYGQGMAAILLVLVFSLAVEALANWMKRRFK